MDVTTLLAPLLSGVLSFWWLWLLLFALAFIKRQYHSPSAKGRRGEARLASRLQKLGQPYRQFHDVTLRFGDGTTQIDHLLVSPFGVFVIETKNYQGWIFGGEKQRYWTQSLYRTKTRFQNPLNQNYKHCLAVEALLGLAKGEAISLVAFVGEATFKTALPDNVCHGAAALMYIRRFSEHRYGPEQVQAMCQTLASARLAPGRDTEARHLAYLKER
ncbi:nuclease-related domain-containing protein [Gallaecimonas pentaromativorans]|uniref:nuclease-related domain-containing protein n=1 Tax=Gallaecimonas pentaromativorans TaxID=584787 RepID=UPI003A8CF896